MKILITGGNGFIGSAITEYLNQQEITTIDYSKPDLDILDKETLSNYVKQSDHVIHLAGLLGTHELTENPGPAIDVNIKGTVNLLECLKGTDKKILFISKPNVWLNTYSITKAASEDFCKMFGKEFGVKYTILKVFNAYGPGQRLDIYKKAVPHFIVNALLNKDIEIYGDGTQTVDLVYTKDIAKIFHKCIFSDIENLDVGSGVELTVNELADMIVDLCNSKSKIVHLPMRMGEVEKTRLCANTDKMVELGVKPDINHKNNMIATIRHYIENLKHYLPQIEIKSPRPGEILSDKE